MAVLIKGMKLPDKCGHCRFATAFDCGVDGQFIKTHNARRKDCPLVEVPEPHGRLIDADALIDKILGMYAFDNSFRFCMKGILLSAPTVIPANPAEEG